MTSCEKGAMPEGVRPVCQSQTPAEQLFKNIFYRAGVVS